VFLGIVFASELIDGQYIVVFSRNISVAKRNARLNAFQTNMIASYEIGDSFHGFAARLSPEELTQLASSDDIAYVEQDQTMHVVACTKQSNAAWGLNRISESELALTGDYYYPDSAGGGIDIYIVDTGILTTHTEFGGRAVWGANYVKDGKDSDCNGHGTHVAGTAAGATYGVAKKSNLIAVKVLGCDGSGTNSGVISGVQFTTKKKTTSVANMSLGGGFSKALNDAVAAAVKEGVTFVVAAGNDNKDACNYSPASELSAITVGATVVSDMGMAHQEDERSYYSNFGTCVSILAPGTLVKSAWWTGNTATNTISGTSMASPHAAGVAALYLADNANSGATPATVKAHLISSSLKGKIDMACGATGTCSKTENRLLYNQCS
jgi:subtilisin family serine protease